MRWKRRQDRMSDRSTWTTEEWRDHLLREARSGREREEIAAMFSRF